MTFRPLTALSALSALALVASVPAFAAPQAFDVASEMFSRADLNNDGELSRVEFDSAREALFRRLDANHDARLTASELRESAPGTGARPARRPGREQIQRLRAVDRNGDRAIDIHEYRALSPERFSQADVNRDGRISRGEIAGLVRAMGLGG